MPIYEYQCEACGHKFEIIQKVSDPLLETCPECKKKALRKLVSAAAFRLKGTGWYATDFKDKKPASQPKKSGENSGTGDKKPDASSDKKESKSSGTDTKKTASGSSGGASD